MSAIPATELRSLRAGQRIKVILDGIVIDKDGRPVVQLGDGSLWVIPTAAMVEVRS